MDPSIFSRSLEIPWPRSADTLRALFPGGSLGGWSSRSILLYTSMVGLPESPNSSQDLEHRGSLVFGPGAGAVDHVQQQPGFADFFQGGSKCRNQGGGKLADETHRVRQDDLPLGGQPDTAQQGIQSGEELVGGQGFRLGQGIEEG